MFSQTRWWSKEKSVQYIVKTPLDLFVARSQESGSRQMTEIDQKAKSFGLDQWVRQMSQLLDLETLKLRRDVNAAFFDVDVLPTKKTVQTLVLNVCGISMEI